MLLGYSPNLIYLIKNRKKAVGKLKIPRLANKICNELVAKAWFSLTCDGVSDGTGDSEYRAIGEPHYTCDDAARV